MTRCCHWLVLLGLLTIAFSNVAGQITIGNVEITQETGSTVTCPGGGSCGLGYTPPSGSNLAGHGFHGYTPPNISVGAGLSAQNYLNSLGGGQGPQFTLCNGNTLFSPCYGLLVNTSSPGNYRQPQNDAGTYLTTTSTSNPITVQFGKNVVWNSTTQKCNGCISEFSLYWGSVDSWNTITFTDASGHSVSFTGTQVAGANSPPIILGQNDIASFVYDFQLIPPSGVTVPAWQSVSFSSSSPAFEFDNISWVTTSATIMGNPITLPSAPEPSSLLLVFAGCTGIAGWIRSRLI